MVEGARLESVYRGNSIEGSNPSLSAIYNQNVGAVPIAFAAAFFSMSVELRKMRHACETQLASMCLRNFKCLAIWAAEISSL